MLKIKETLIKLIEEKLKLQLNCQNIKDLAEAYSILTKIKEKKDENI